MTVIEALLHLRSRLLDIETVDSRHRPHWNQADLDAVSALVERPAAGEQIALARIEGRITGWGGVYVSAEMKSDVRTIARQGLGLTP